jgi:hypothetical protein
MFFAFPFFELKLCSSEEEELAPNDFSSIGKDVNLVLSFTSPPDYFSPRLDVVESNL